MPFEEFCQPSQGFDAGEGAHEVNGSILFFAGRARQHVVCQQCHGYGLHAGLARGGCRCDEEIDKDVARSEISLQSANCKMCQQLAEVYTKVA